MLKFQPQKLLSHLFIVICIIVSIFGFINENFFYNFAFHSGIFSYGNISQIISQTTAFQFLHGNILHLVFNVYFLYTFWPEVEARMSREKFFVFFLISTALVAVTLNYFSSGVTIGISGFCMALLAYLAADLYSTRHYAFGSVVTMLVFNIAIGLFAGISFTGHFFGAVAGIIFWLLFAKHKKLF